MIFCLWQKLRQTIKRIISRSSLILLLLLFLLSALLPPTSAQIVASKRPSSNLVKAEYLVEQGKALYEAEQYTQAVKILQQAVTSYAVGGDRVNQAMTLSNLSLAYQKLGLWTEAGQANHRSLNLLEDNFKDYAVVQAQSLDVQGLLELNQGQATTALETWQKSAAIYTQISKNHPLLTRNQINQAQALQTLGFYSRAQKILVQTAQTLQNQPDSATKATGLLSLGNVWRAEGKFNESLQILAKSLEVAQKLSNPEAIAQAYLSLGNTANAQQETQAALQYYQQADQKATAVTTKIQANLNQLNLLQKNKQFTAARKLLPKINSRIDNLPNNRTTLYAKINFAQSLWKLKQNTTIAYSWQDIAQLLNNTIQAAQTLKDQHAESYAWGILGLVDQQQENLVNAQQTTAKALSIAQAINAPELIYQWQWQLGRLLKQAGSQDAIIAYEEAVTTLQSLRRDLATINADVQFSFRDRVEPVYRELVDLLLNPNQGNEPTTVELTKARQAIESLQLAELDNYLRQACLNAKVDLDRVVDLQDPTAAVIYPIILRDRLEVILKLPKQQLIHYTAYVPQSQVETTLDELQRNLLEPDTLKNVQRLSKQVYQWLIEPGATKLAQSQVKTLIFVLDNPLRKIPMATLYDGQHYLIEQYAIALTLGLQLVEPKAIETEKLAVLIAGLSQARQGFSELKYVEEEVKQIRSTLPNQLLFDRQFTTQTFQDQINSQPFPIVHLATHGQFSSNSEQTYVLAWDKPIKGNDLNNLIKDREQRPTNAIELLVLSACQTATGDKQAVLGLAGLAVSAGARSTIASLWNVNDASTALMMNQFYQGLVNKKLGIAEAFRQAQLSLLKNPQYQAPLFWSPYILIGNWL
ncbi:MAG: CHAT domain-containing protein [Waterburya sp.]